MFKKNAKKGQGVVEYAGALVVAAVIIAGVIAFAPDALTATFQNIITTIDGFLQTGVQNAQAQAGG